MSERGENGSEGVAEGEAARSYRSSILEDSNDRTFSGKLLSGKI